MALKIQYDVVPAEKVSNIISFSYVNHIKFYYIVIHIFLFISMENNRAIYPCICTLYVYIALVQL